MPTAERVLAMVILSVRMSVRHDPVYNQAQVREIETPGFHHMTAQESLVSYELIWCRWVGHPPPNDRGHQI